MERCEQIVGQRCDSEGNPTDDIECGQPATYRFCGGPTCEVCANDLVEEGVPSPGELVPIDPTADSAQQFAFTIRMALQHDEWDEAALTAAIEAARSAAVAEAAHKLAEWAGTLASVEPYDDYSEGKQRAFELVLHKLDELTKGGHRD